MTRRGAAADVLGPDPGAGHRRGRRSRRTSRRCSRAGPRWGRRAGRRGWRAGPRHRGVAASRRAGRVVTPPGDHGTGQHGDGGERRAGDQREAAVAPAQHRRLDRRRRERAGAVTKPGTGRGEHGAVGIGRALRVLGGRGSLMSCPPSLGVGLHPGGAGQRGPGPPRRAARPSSWASARCSVARRRVAEIASFTATRRTHAPGRSRRDTRRHRTSGSAGQRVSGSAAGRRGP